MPDPFPIPTSLPNNGLIVDTIFNNVIEVVIIIIAIAAFVAIVYSGVMMITSGGDATKFATARKNLFWAIIGLVVSILSFFLVSTVYDTFKTGTVKGPTGSSGQIQPWTS